MAKLTSEQRRNLPEDVFGLPEERAYPMPDGEHVSSAITYFGSCPLDKRKELAANINRLAKKYNVKVKLSKGSKFKPYADKEILEESANLVVEMVIPFDVRKIIVNERMANIDHEIRTIDEFNREMYDSNRGQGDVKNLLSTRIDKAVCIAIRNAATDYLNKQYMCNGPREDKGSFVDFVYDSDRDLCYDITRDFVYAKSVDDPAIQKEISLVHDKEMLKNAFLSTKNHIDVPIVNDLVNDVVARVTAMNSGDDIMKNIDDKLGAFATDPAYKDYEDYLTGCVTPDMFVGAIPSESKNFSEEEIDTISSSIGIISELAARSLTMLCAKMNYPPMDDIDAELANIVPYMEKKHVIDGYYLHSYSGAFNKFIKMGSVIYVLLHSAHNAGHTHCFVTAMKVLDANRPTYLSEVVAEYHRRNDKLPQMPIRKITIPRSDPNTTPMLEGIHISKDGDISLSLDISKSNMDRYAACHKVVVTDAKSGNTEALKHDLAYMFALVCTIEDKYYGDHRKKVEPSNEEGYDDAIKARAFAINDIKTYMKVIHAKEPRFNFYKFYTDNKYDKKIYTLRHTTITGLKNLLRVILA